MNGPVNGVMNDLDRAVCRVETICEPREADHVEL